MAKNSSSDLSIEKVLFAGADKLRGAIDPSEYKYVVLGLIFLKYISDSFEIKYNTLVEEGYGSEEDRDEYLADGIFFCPEIARWSYISKYAKSDDIGEIIDNAMIAIEKENSNLKGVLPKNYNRASLNKNNLGGLIDLFTNNISFGDLNEEKDVLGRVYEYFISNFASTEGKRGGEFYTPKSIVKTLVEIIKPYKGKVYDPCCGSGGMFIQSEKFTVAHGHRVQDIWIHGQEYNESTRRLCLMNLAIRGINGNIGESSDDTLRNDLHKTLKADYILANPPFNQSEWGHDILANDVRWSYGLPPKGNANYAWLQHMIHHLNHNGVAGVVLANGSMSTATNGELEVRKNMIKDGVVEAIVALPGQMFFSTQIPACLWILRKGRSAEEKKKTLFIDAREIGFMADRVHKEFTDEDIANISTTYDKWKSKSVSAGLSTGSGLFYDAKTTRVKGHVLVKDDYKDIAGFCKSASLEEIEKNDWVLTPGRYVGIAESEEDSEPFEEKFPRLLSELKVQIKKETDLNEEILKQMSKVEV
ncbi:MAG: type I restriction-modification system subunit M [Alphaproteobacteria bacterium]|jgi:type I restriction enzyme M protein|nr:type I restriction-modification system subunit M [Alphaproteobacteria bacterium]